MTDTRKGVSKMSRKTKIFNGITYYLDDDEYKTKVEAKISARSYRANKTLARVVRSTDTGWSGRKYWAVYYANPVDRKNRKK